MTQDNKPNIEMLSINEAARSSKTCRSTINSRIKLWDDAVKAGVSPPPGALESRKWGSRRLTTTRWLARAMGMDGEAA